ncbi:MAG: tripartite tricarboxylate transporter substrate binding protein, partial [Bryobacteraceae bacterium]
MHMENGAMNALITTLALVAGLSLAADAPAQSYPSKSVRVVIPLSAGSGVDLVGRSVSQKLSSMWGQPVVVDNRSGAGGTIGTAIVAKAPPDGYTVLISGSSHAANPSVYATLPYDALNDFMGIAPLASLPQALLVAPSAGVKSVSELIGTAKARPGILTFATPGAGTGNHFASEKFRLMAGIDVVHVPFKGGPEAMTDVMTGRVTFLLNSIGAALPFIQGGKLLALGVSSPRRSTRLPDVPTIAESGLADFQSSLWFGLWVPRGTSARVVDKLARDTAHVLAESDMREVLRNLSAEPMKMTPTEFSS